MTGSLLSGVSVSDEGDRNNRNVNKVPWEHSRALCTAWRKREGKVKKGFVVLTSACPSESPGSFLHVYMPDSEGLEWLRLGTYRKFFQMVLLPAAVMNRCKAMGSLWSF